MGISAINPFELPLLNTVNSTILNINVAVWVGISLYILNLSKNLILFILPGINLDKFLKSKLNKSYSTINIENNEEFSK
jgi:hypothetical protein